MPQIQILPSVPTFGSQLGRTLGEGLGSGISEGINVYYQQKEQERKFDEQREKSRLSAQKGLPSLLKQVAPELEGNPEAFKSIRKSLYKYIDEGIPLSDAYLRAFSDYEKENPFLPKKSVTGAQTSDVLRKPVSLPFDVSPQTSGFYESPQKGAEVPGGVAGFAKEHPLQALATVPREAIALAEQFGGLHDPANILNLLREGGRQPSATELFEKGTGLAELPPEMKKEAEILGFTASVLPWGKALGAVAKGIEASGFGKLFNRIFNTRAAQTGQEAAKVAQDAVKAAEKVGVDLEKVAQGQKAETKRLYDVIRKEETPTVARAERVEKGTPKFQPKEESALRERQLKEHPRYAEEISRDAAERAERLERVIPKTEKGMVGLQQRRMRAQTELPRMQELYRGAIARNRALEDAYISAKGTEKENLKKILDISRQELRESEDALSKTISNSKHGTSKVGMGEQRKAAQEKILKLQDDVADGKEISLSKADYNPEIVREAKRVEKLKEPSGAPRDKFYEQVHDNYEKVYQSRLDTLNKEIKGLSGKVRNLSEAQHFRNLQKEKEILDKMIQQTQAEKLLHRRKLRLREMAERKKSEQRLKQFKLSKAPRVEEVARPVLEKSIKTPEVKKGIEEIKKESSSFLDALKQVKDVKSEKEIPLKVTNRLESLAKEFQDMIKSFPKIWSTPMGKDVLAGALGPIFDEFLKDNDINITGASFVSVLAGRSGYRGFGIRSISNQLSRSLIKELKLSKIADAYQKRDREKIVEYQKKYSTKLMKEGREKAFGR